MEYPASPTLLLSHLKSEGSTSDVSLHVWVVVIQEVTTEGLQTTRETSYHINLLELKAAYGTAQFKLDIYTCVTREISRAIHKSKSLKFTCVSL